MSFEATFGEEPDKSEVQPQGVKQPAEARQEPVQEANVEPPSTTVEPEHELTAWEKEKKGLIHAAEAERKGRQDWKEQATRAQERLRVYEEQRQAETPREPMEPMAALQQQMVTERFNTSEMMVRDKFTDVDEFVDPFMEEVRKNPALAAQLHSHPHPWKFAYDEGKRMKFAQEIGADPDAYRKKLRAEVEAELRAESSGKQPSTNLPQSLAGARSSGTRGATWTGPTPMDTMFPN